MLVNTTQTGQSADGDTQADKPKTVKASHKAKPDGVHIVKAGKRLHIDMYILEDTPPEAIGKAVTDACLQFKEEQNKPKPPKPDPKAKRAAEAIRKAELEAAKAAKKLADLKAKVDGTAKPAAGEPADVQHQDNLKKAVDAGLLGEKGKAVVQFREKMAEIIKLQQDHKAAGSEEEKARLKAEIEKKSAELEAIKKTLEASVTPSTSQGDSHSFKLPMPPELANKCEAEIAMLEKKCAEANTPEDKAVQKAALIQARLNYNTLRKDFGAPPIDYPEIS